MSGQQMVIELVCLVLAFFIVLFAVSVLNLLGGVNKMDIKDMYVGQKVTCVRKGLIQEGNLLTVKEILPTDDFLCEENPWYHQAKYYEPYYPEQECGLDDELIEAHKMYNATTKGEWETLCVGMTTHGDSYRNTVVPHNGYYYEAICSTKEMSEKAEADIEFIAYAHNEWPKLLERLERAERRIREDKD